MLALYTTDISQYVVRRVRPCNAIACGGVSGDTMGKSNSGDPWVSPQNREDQENQTHRAARRQRYRFDPRRYAVNAGDLGLRRGGLRLRPERERKPDGGEALNDQSPLRRMFSHGCAAPVSMRFSHRTE